MRKLRYYPYSIVSLMVVILLFIGCNFTHVMKANEFSSLQTGSPLRGVPPKTFAFKDFKDIRNADNPSLLMHTGFFHDWVVEPPPAVLVPILIKKELERNGHKCVTFSPQVKADFIVEGNIYKYTGNLFQGFSIGSFSINTGVRIMISSIPAEQDVFVKSYVGNYSYVGHESWEFCMNMAFMSMINEMSTDLELVDFLNKSATVKTSAALPAYRKIPEKIETKKSAVAKQVPSDVSNKLLEQSAEVQKKEPSIQEVPNKTDTIVVDKKPSAEITKPNIPSSSNLETPSKNSSLSENSQKLRELKKLKDEGLLTEEEYAQKRKAILESM